MSGIGIEKGPQRRFKRYPAYKDSGVEWLGEIPAHWEVKRLKQGMEFTEGPGIMAAAFTVEGVPLLRIAGIGGRTATLEGCNYLSPALVRQRWEHFRVRNADLLIINSGSASTGFCTEVDAVTEGAVPYTGIIIIRPRSKVTCREFVRSAHDVPVLMRELVEWLNAPGDVHPVLASGAAQFQLVHIHPFRDGNGRTSRLLSTLCLYRAGYDFKRLFTISEYYDRDRSTFYRAIQSVRERGMDLAGGSSSSRKGWRPNSTR